VIKALCSQCGTMLEPEDAFCTSCGHRRDAEPVPTPPPVISPVEVAAPPAPPTVAPVEEPKAEEPVTFSFGGTMVAMKDDSKSPEKPAKVGGGAPGRGMSSTQSAILSFVLIAVVLGVAFYFVTK